jgi:hypothetical protein
MTISPASTAGKNPIPVSSSTAIEAAKRRGVDGLSYVVGDVNAPAAGPRCGGGAHERFRNLKKNAANTRTIPTLTISRSQKWCLKNRTSTPTTAATIAST